MQVEIAAMQRRESEDTRKWRGKAAGLRFAHLQHVRRRLHIVGAEMTDARRQRA
jgi:hypothetical protein